jgi:calcineurin-like phosphoesterase family protein
LIYFIADTHFGHKNIIRFCDRPFNTVKEMDNEMISLWNKTVNDGDEIIHLGDFSYRTSPEDTKSIFQSLRGKISLLMGNHDRKYGIDYWKDIGFDRVYDSPIVLDNKLLLSHKQLIDKRYLNVHGHSHENKVKKALRNYALCVSVEQINYRPISIVDILNKYKL